ncbi:hypothetical protein BOO92_15100 [Vibrio navarrensis]|uniref:DUF6482 family protein n=1 Tax=Vibrio navarrensis TaxID=29495 RepID=UPI0018686DD6|nr:DUF6482 family protein [Vibrio navarrensis]MBE3651543.1 hypothetical protein [Vibrio navarrensis]MBE3658005.1 hypothetical protein [Vibrio navarrensis]
MQKHQLDLWMQSHYKEGSGMPKVFVVGRSNVNEYSLAVEYKHHFEPIIDGDELIHFTSLEQVKDELVRLGIDKAYLRLHNAYEECGSPKVSLYCDIEIAVTPH